jgi:alpha-glucosidase
MMRLGLWSNLSDTLARKQRWGTDWYIGSITNEKKREFDVPLKFLDKNRSYVAEIYRDADDADWKTNPIAYKIEKQLVPRDSILSLHLAPG